MIKFFSDVQQVGGFKVYSLVSANNKAERHDKTEIVLKSSSNTHNTNHKGLSKMSRIYSKSEEFVE